MGKALCSDLPFPYPFGATMPESNFQGSQPNFVGYQAADGSSFSGDLIMPYLAKNNIVISSWGSAENWMAHTASSQMIIGFYSHVTSRFLF